MATVPGTPTELILYVGNDESYWSTIKQRYQNNYGHLNFKFEMFFEKDYKQWHKSFLKIFAKRPAVVYIDCSKDDFRKDLCKVAQLLRREVSFEKVPVVGLVDKKELFKELVTAGFHFVHVKCGEYHDVIWDPMVYAMPEKATKPEFATAKFSKPAKLYEDFRIGFISPTGVHVEANFYAQKGDAVKIQTEIPIKLIPSKNYVVSKQQNHNLYYDYRYAYDLDFVYVDEPQKEAQSDGAPESEEVKALMGKSDKDFERQLAQHKDEVRIAKKKMRQWVQGNMVGNEQKKTKILVVDPDLSFINHSEKGLDDYPFVIRCTTTLSDQLSEIDHIRPNIIAYELVEYKESDFEGLNDDQVKVKKAMETESLEQLTAIIQRVKEIDKYNPFVVLFNSAKFTSKSFQDSFKYPLVLTNKEPLALEMVVGMAKLYEEKQETKTNQLIQNKINVLKKENPVKYGRLSLADFKDERYYVGKTRELSIGCFEHEINIVSLSESEITFETESLLQEATYRLVSPTDMSVRIIPVGGVLCTEVQGMRQYHGLIHSIGEQDKKRLRQYVNEIFFSDLNEKREKEQEEFKKKNEEGAAKKAAQKSAEEEARLLAEEAAKAEAQAKAQAKVEAEAQAKAEAEAQAKAEAEASSAEDSQKAAEQVESDAQEATEVKSEKETKKTGTDDE